MIILKRYKEIPKKFWKEESQKMELDVWKNSKIKEDRNSWWKNSFNNYDIIKDEKIGSIMEVGCGPFAYNMQYIIDSLNNKPNKIILNDPLLSDYIEMKRPVSTLIENNKAEINNQPLEELQIGSPIDMIIMINVLDHVYNLKLCLDTVYKYLKTGGILVFGNDLTSEKNFKDTPTDDPFGMMHPIRFNYRDIKKYLNQFDKLYKKIIPPSTMYHCGILTFIGRKK